MAIEITNSNFEEQVLKADKAVLVDFWASWCGPCRMLAPVVDAIAEAHSDRLILGKVNVDEQPELSMQFGVMSIPTLVLFKNGKKIAQTVGFQDRGALEQFVAHAL